MKKLMYNENTKEVDVAEEDFPLQEEEREKPRRVKIWLENNKIFFEIFSFVIVGAMGVIISFVTWKTDERSAEIYQKQLEIEDNTREPYFETKELNIEDKKKAKLTIENRGGRITSAGASIVPFFKIVIDNYGKEYKFVVPLSHDVYLGEDYGPIYRYDENERTFIFDFMLKEELTISSKKIEDTIKNHLNTDSVSVTLERWIGIEYINYKNEKYQIVYELNFVYLVKIDEETDIQIIGELDNDNMGDIVKEISNHINDN